ncbi:peptidoglycan DD-metalloendopeptidase family protein [Candidatus Parcubacteria bacterium]|uniref:NlpC/P60 domain-containing protein n=2 Tax=Candidatus Zambryskiibacteriota TaxID=1817925 RepID=A0A2H0K694_9BACT|nr:peptidoglycan DD-metalloendopeptidase family protein [Candidatus Parcubacteria bacterium]PIQ66755.1 MAG: hypothetical protein COV95_02485 [Candidatus Zambryskibacteria bacterium CG11_big_fil_rev_8_21_14_0_20_40_24]
MNEQALLDEIFTRMESEGFAPGTEQYEICRKSLDFLGFSYKRSEELEAGTVVDCSTLTSQSHWEGALIGIPFVADNQRQAVSGEIIASVDKMIPGDVLVKYPSLDASPDKTWNHVGLYLGRDNGGEQWLIESTSKTGVRVAKVAEFDAQGGIKRFSLTTKVFSTDAARNALTLASMVPKFGRLGVRQYLKSGGERPVHNGVDVYIQPGTPVFATEDGKVRIVHDEPEDADGVEIIGDSFTVRYRPLALSVHDGTVVRVGDLIGHVAESSISSNIQYSTTSNHQSHLHLEVEINSATRIPTEATIGGKRYANHLYLSKIGRLTLPFRL